ncbi:unnamed protein product [Phytophthora fragariaefolia]|uniref:Unnamed protein product n=1 Tax=Phytophthora fragariaefolia TaxID=1490495 RepID=A0A9W6X081_9STRA|nr:unnamed protein product [Phytophthora fragariaefolia]
MKKEDARAAGEWCVPVHCIGDGTRAGFSQETYATTISAVQSSYRDEYADNVASKLQPKLLVFRSSPHEAQLDFQIECAASPVLFKFSLVRNLPLLMTPLAASLARREFSARSSNMRSGYLTLDRTRKAVPLLKVDPLVLQQPLVGVWVYGVQIDDAWDEEIARRQLADPFLYFACIGYLMSEAIRERVGPEKNTFLVALYPGDLSEDGSAVGSLPRFFECHYSEFLSPPARPLPMELYSHRRSCLVGVSKFSTDVELTLSAAPTSEWEAAKCQAKIPTASSSAKAQNPEVLDSFAIADNNSHTRTTIPASENEEDEDVTSGWTITSNANRKSASLALNNSSQASMHSDETANNPTVPGKVATENVEFKAARSTSSSTSGQHDATCTYTAKESAEETAGLRQRGWSGNNTSSYRSCCKTQQLLTIQHQQILENQQKQLHEMQEQIAQLRRLLDEARCSSKKEANPVPNDAGYDSDASSSSIGAVADVSNVSSTLSRHENDHGAGSSQSSVVSISKRSGDFLDKPSIYSPSKSTNKGEAEDEEQDMSLSSLDLSSISSASVDVDLSSLSSSLLSEPLRHAGSSSNVKEVQAHDKHVDPEAEALNQPKVSTEQTTAQGETLADAGVSTGLADEGRDKIERDTDEIVRDTCVQDLSVGDLSDSLRGEATRSGETIDASVGSHEDDENDDASGDRSVVERLLPPDVYLRKVGGFVDHHGGCFTTPPLDFHSFCVPRIKFSNDAPECSLSDSEDEEIRLIEQKYKRLMAA